jgi:hypothetical protein
VETDGCVRSCSVDHATVGISSNSLLDPHVAGAVCSLACLRLRGCPNIVDLYSNVDAGEGKQYTQSSQNKSLNLLYSFTNIFFSKSI